MVHVRQRCAPDVPGVSVASGWFSLSLECLPIVNGSEAAGGTPRQPDTQRVTYIHTPVGDLDPNNMQPIPVATFKHLQSPE